MKFVNVLGLVVVAGLALTMGLTSCKKAPAPASENAAPVSQLPGDTTTQANAPIQPAPSAQPTK
jgi:hypothetical protein